VKNFDETGSAVKKKGGSVKTVRTPPQTGNKSESDILRSGDTSVTVN
jgi:hypothetical protein